MSTDSAMEAEFDVVARWTQEAVELLGPDHAIPAGCRGSSSPSALAWLGEACELAGGSVLLDAGGGVGGPAAYAADRFGVRTVVVDPMVGACRAAAALFGLPAIVGTGERLPIATASMDAVWCLGVLCTTSAQAPLLGELRRVLRPGRPLGLLVFVASVADVSGAPDANHFPTEPEFAGLLRDAGFAVVQQSGISAFGDPPRSWSDRAARVDRIVAERHGDDPRFVRAQAEERQVGELVSSGRVSGLLVHAVAPR